MLKKREKPDIITPEIKLEVDIMNRNTIIGLSMMYALWESKKQDLLSLITPFVLYCVGTTTVKGRTIDIRATCKEMEQEFGYKEIHPEVISHVLSRESKKQQDNTQVIVKQNKSYVLVGSLDEHVSAFKEKRTTCKERTESVSRALANYLNLKSVYNRSNYSEADAESYLLAFFEKQFSWFTLVWFKRRCLFIGFDVGIFEKHFAIFDNDKRISQTCSTASYGLNFTALKNNPGLYQV